MRALNLKSDAAVTFRGVTLTKWLSAELLGSVETLVRLFAETRISGERLGRLQILDHGAEINRFGIERLVFRDLGRFRTLKP